VHTARTCSDPSIIVSRAERNSRTAGSALCTSSNIRRAETSVRSVSRIWAASPTRGASVWFRYISRFLRPSWDRNSAIGLSSAFRFAHSCTLYQKTLVLSLTVWANLANNVVFPIPGIPLITTIRLVSEVRRAARTSNSLSRPKKALTAGFLSVKSTYRRSSRMRFAWKARQSRVPWTMPLTSSSRSYRFGR